MTQDLDLVLTANYNGFNTTVYNRQGCGSSTCEGVAILKRLDVSLVKCVQRKLTFFFHSFFFNAVHLLEFSYLQVGEVEASDHWCSCFIWRPSIVTGSELRVPLLCFNFITARLAFGRISAAAARANGCRGAHSAQSKISVPAHSAAAWRMSWKLNKPNLLLLHNWLEI